MALRALLSDHVGSIADLVENRPAQQRRQTVEKEWIKALADGRRVKFTSQELVATRAFMTAQGESSKIVYSIILTTSLAMRRVEGYFEGEQSKKSSDTELGHCR
jgi:hypothetical protein